MAKRIVKSPKRRGTVQLSVIKKAVKAVKASRSSDAVMDEAMDIYSDTLKRFARGEF